MGVLERWDERNQAWADRKRAEPLPAGRRDRWGIFGAFLLWTWAVLWSVGFVVGLVRGAWLAAAFRLPGVILLGLLAWALIRGRSE